MASPSPSVIPNRRTAPRVRLRFPLRFCCQHRPDVLFSGVTENISASGILFATEERVDVATSLKLFIDALPGDRQARQLSAVVIRTEIDEARHRYYIGAKFTHLSDADRQQIQAALQATDIMGLLRLAGKKEASDLHLAANHPPLVRIAGQLMPLRRTPLSGGPICGT
ncbi:MAG: hypothetical protein KatS3mg131_0946 [Candidatus Tectimicrobiota bacterium]|nr:MAG: hypothetical protein KatS3mg131_0946 [Candidatus Tectomicrobia bacterium]